MGDQRVDVETTMIDLASSQHGVVARSQSLHAGVPADVVDRRLKTKWFRIIHRGVYLIGPVLSARAREMAAVLACGGAGALSHRCAVARWQLKPGREDRAQVEVSIAGGAHPRLSGVRVHRVRTLPADEVTLIDGIPITTVARTLCDLATVAEQRELERAFEEALGRGFTNRAEILAVSGRWSRRPGSGRMRAPLQGEVERRRRARRPKKDSSR
jgi:predicted transcriptional regulator of viral defense system